jgi:hypothetical protein
VAGAGRGQGSCRGEGAREEQGAGRMNEISAKDITYLSSAVLEIAAQLEKLRQTMNKIYDRLEVTNIALEEIGNTTGRGER